MQFLRREADGSHAFILTPLASDESAATQEPFFFHSPCVNFKLFILQRLFACLMRFHHVFRNLIAHFQIILRDIAFQYSHFEFHFFSRFIQPIGVVGSDLHLNQSFCRLPVCNKLQDDKQSKKNKTQTFYHNSVIVNSLFMVSLRIDKARKSSYHSVRN